MSNRTSILGFSEKAMSPAMALLLVALAVIVGSLGATPAEAGKSPQVGQALPDMDWITVTGDTMSWDALRSNRPLVVVFWATWCRVCKKDWPRIETLLEKYADAPLPPAIAAVSLGEKPDRVAEVAKKRKLPGWIIADPDEHNGNALGIEYVPLVGIVSPAGKLVYWGSPRIGEMDKILEKLTTDKKER